MFVDGVGSVTKMDSGGWLAINQLISSIYSQIFVCFFCCCCKCIHLL